MAVCYELRRMVLLYQPNPEEGGGSSIGAPHVVQIAMGCDGQPILPFLREELEGEPKYRRHIERAGRSGPRYLGPSGPRLKGATSKPGGHPIKLSPHHKVTQGKGL